MIDLSLRPLFSWRACSCTLDGPLVYQPVVHPLPGPSHSRGERTRSHQDFMVWLYALTPDPLNSLTHMVKRRRRCRPAPSACECKPPLVSLQATPDDCHHSPGSGSLRTERNFLSQGNQARFSFSAADSPGQGAVALQRSGACMCPRRKWELCFQ